MTTRKTILIFGISSFVGSNLAEFLKKDFKVVGTYYSTPVKIPGVLTLPCDVLNKEEVQLVLFSVMPDIAIYTAGLSSIIDCSKSKSLADKLNTIGLFNVSEYCQRYKSQICYISSNQVFGGEDKYYLEMDIPDANTTLGKTKASAEFFIQKNSLNYLIFRCCNFYGRGINQNQMTSFEVLQEKLKRNKNVTCDNMVFDGYLDINYLAMIMKICFDKDASNRLFQISSSDHMTFNGFANEYCKVFGESEELISKGRWHFPFKAATTSNYDGGELYFKLDVSNVEGFLNIKFPSISDSLKFTYKRFNGEESTAKKNLGSEGIKFI